jgi:hypothetical protein
MRLVIVKHVTIRLKCGSGCGCTERMRNGYGDKMRNGYGDKMRHFNEFSPHFHVSVFFIYVFL